MTRIMVVDDSTAMRDLLRDILEMSGFAVEEADSAEAAGELLGQFRCDVLVADIFLPGRDGLWLIREARAKGLAKRMVAVTGGGSVGGLDALEAARIAGADHVLAKPFSAAALIAAIRGTAAANPAAG
jgi:DNA-binding response OmpR family regulator